MKCNVCGNKESKVIDSRTSDDGTSIRRRRECIACGHRFTTYETLELVSLLVIKNDGTRQPFDELKIKNGIIKSCEKRPVTAKAIEDMVFHVKQQCLNTLASEISSKRIGEMVMEELKSVEIDFVSDENLRTLGKFFAVAFKFDVNFFEVVNGISAVNSRRVDDMQN